MHACVSVRQRMYLRGILIIANLDTEDGKLLDLDCENLGIKSLVEECDRHSRALQKQADLADA